MSFVDLVQIIGRMPGVGEAILASAVLAALVARPLARRLGGSAVQAALTVAGVGVVLTVTLVPHLRWLDTRLLPGNWQNLQYCGGSWSRAAVHAVGSLEGRANVVLFAVPALLATLWLRRPALAVAASAGLSVAVEVLQTAVSGGGCQASDLVANTLGATIGVLCAVAVLGVTRGLRERRPRPVT